LSRRNGFCSHFRGGGGSGLSSLGNFPRHADDLAFAVCPKVDADADEVVDGGIGALVEEGGDEDADGVDGQTSGDAAVHGAVGDEPRERIFPAEAEQTGEDVEHLQGGEGLDGAVEGLVQ